MDRMDIEFYNGLIKGIVSCHEIMEKSSSKEEAQEKVSVLLKKMRKKISAMVDDALA